MRKDSDSRIVATARRAVSCLLLGAALLLANPIACDEAPGCGPGCGGCTNKQAIEDYQYSGPACLFAQPNDCTWNSIEFLNSCTGPAVFNGGEIPAHSGYQYMDPVKRTDGSWAICGSGGTCGGTPASAETVELDGTVDGQVVHIRFYVTGEQC